MVERVVVTTNGRIRGTAVDGVSAYLGVPYAAAPVGKNRFAAPRPHEPWAEIFDATRPGPTAPQIVKPFPGIDLLALVGEGWIKGDDYLTTNIWTPDPGGTGLPVMVFIHGGGFVGGSNNAPVSNGSAFASAGVVCVAINYRMGVDGFLPIPGIPTNLGLRDQIAALQWVQENIPVFGGDPANVTVFGESAGAMSIANLIVSPLAKGLFRRAIIESGHGAMTRDIGIARRLVKKMATLLKIKPDEAGFRSVEAGDTLDALEKISMPTTRLDLRDAEGREPVFGISRFIPVHGDDVLPEKPLDALKAGAGAGIDVLIGTNTEEMNLYLVATGLRDKIGRLLSTYVLHRSMPRANAALKAYGMGKKGEKPGHVLTRALSDLVFRWPARRYGEEHRGRTHIYEFGWQSPAFDGAMGACHAVELPFVFNTLATATGPEGMCGAHPPQDLADRMHALWVGYAKDGRLPWPEFDRDTRIVYRIETGEAAYEPVMPAAAFLP